ncbi:hypothetical protein D3C79_785470 [compost metagenome]
MPPACSSNCKPRAKPASRPASICSNNSKPWAPIKNVWSRSWRASPRCCPPTPSMNCAVSRLQPSCVWTSNWPSAWTCCNGKKMSSSSTANASRPWTRLSSSNRRGHKSSKSCKRSSPSLNANSNRARPASPACSPGNPVPSNGSTTWSRRWSRLASNRRKQPSNCRTPRHA